MANCTITAVTRPTVVEIPTRVEHEFYSRSSVAAEWPELGPVMDSDEVAELSALIDRVDNPALLSFWSK